MKPVPAAYQYTGGKGKLLAHLLPHVPPHDAYVELFAGGLALLRAKERSHVEVVNDINRDLVTFLRYARYHRDALKRELATCVQSRADFEDLKATQPQTDLQRALRWYFLQVASFGGKGQHFGRSRTDFHGFSAARHLDLIEQLGARLDRVYIECKDWPEVVDWYDGAGTFFFCDPPYVGCADTAYEAWTEHQLQRLRDRLDRVRGTWMLTINDAPATRAIFDGLPFRELAIRYTLGTRHVARAKQSGELLILSPRLATAGAQRLAA